MLKTKLSLCAASLISLTSYVVDANAQDTLYPYGEGITLGDDSSFALMKFDARVQMRYTSDYDSDPAKQMTFLLMKNELLI